MLFMPYTEADSPKPRQEISHIDRCTNYLAAVRELVPKYPGLVFEIGSDVDQIESLNRLLDEIPTLQDPIARKILAQFYIPLSDRLPERLKRQCIGSVTVSGYFDGSEEFIIQAAKSVEEILHTHKPDNYRRDEGYEENPYYCHFSAFFTSTD
jgi:hypothetical protein